VNGLRVFFVGGLTSYRALFHWLSPWIFVPMLVVTPLFQLLFFAYLGRTTGVRSDGYFIVGNALLAAALPGLWGMSWSISGERRTQTLGTLLVSPANRYALFLGRALPTVVNGLLVSGFCFVTGSLLLGYRIGAEMVPGLALAIFACAFSCTALGLCVASLGMRGRNVTVLDNLLLGALLVFSGANVPLDRLPPWMHQIGSRLPLTHGVEAAREIADGSRLGSVTHLLALEIVIACVYALVGMTLLRVFEWESRRTASLETF
jgi:ABC-2 type transport system permease protein